MPAELEVRVVPRARRTEIAGEREGALVVRVREPPLDDRANKAVCKLIAKELGVPTGRVSIVRGHRARQKMLRVEGIDQAALRSALGLS